MSELVRHLLEDNRAGLQVDADGRRYFRPRRVRFRTIDMSAADLFQAGWLRYENPLTPPYRAGNANPSHREIREFATRASERFQEFWYRVFDVAVARALAGRDIRVFQERPFFRPNTFFDTGIPDAQSLSSVPPQLHQKIHAEYLRSRDASTRRRVYYLSNYLTDVTGDVIEALEPYRAFWALKDRRRDLLDRINVAYTGLTDALLPPQIRDRLSQEIDTRLLRHLDGLVADRGERGVSDAAVRTLIHRRRAGDLKTLSSSERKLIFAADSREVGLPENLRAMAESLELLGESRARARSAAGYSSAAYRLDLRRARLNYMMRLRANSPRDPAAARSLAERRGRYLKLFLERLGELSGQPRSDSNAMKTTRPSAPQQILARLIALREFARRLRIESEDSGDSPGNIGALLESWHAPENLPAASPESLAAAREDLAQLQSVAGIVGGLRRAETEIADYFESYASARDDGEDHPTQNDGDEAEGEGGATTAQTTAPDGDAVDANPQTTESTPITMYSGPGRALRLAEDQRIGNPFDETEILQAARQLIFHRLRPVRRTANHYSLNPGHRHGAVTLNPVMKLWKDRPESGREGPGLIRLEMNTRATVECLLELACLVDPDLASREVRRESKVLRESRGPENLGNLLTLLLPGSCYSLREVHRLDFPEFRGKVLGETRNPTELGVDPREDSLLTGAWYQKLNHALYYPVGGDHGRLLRLIWNSARAPGPPAFLFALGQFVHDCLADDLIYFKTAEKTFRECVEDYYLQEDRVRKNRGERMGRRRPDNSRAGVRFMFAILYSRLVMEALTGSSQSHFRHPPTETWMMRHLNLPVLNRTDRGRFTQIRSEARRLIESMSEEQAADATPAQRETRNGTP
ncbi:MAG: hypothetical protein NXI24_17990 [bacterium]|nr:hypothetical protein [bacterium]